MFEIPKDQLFHLDGLFIAGFIGRQPAWGPVGYVTYKRTYARDIKERTVPTRVLELGREHRLKTEEWWLTLVRVIEGVYQVQQRHCASLRLSWNSQQAQESAQEMYVLMWGFRFLPPGRGLWSMGTDHIEKVGAGALNNCGFVSTDAIDVSFSDPFCWIMDMSMLGVGVGFDDAGSGLIAIQEPELVHCSHIISDDREGWVSAYRRLLDAFVGIGTLPTVWDVSNVRPKGAPIVGFGGTASGPEPLLELLATAEKILVGYIGKTVDAALIGDLGNIAGRCVVAGNVRRSAEIFIGDPKDEQFLRLKDRTVIENAEPIDMWRWASNNTNSCVVGQDYARPARFTAENGENGYLWLENARAFSRMGHPPDFKDKRAKGCNPCGEQTLESYELCCLVETFPSLHATFAEYKRTLKFAYLYAKTVTLLPTHDSITNAVLLRNRRIGSSQSGIVQSIMRHGLREHMRWCDSGYAYLQELDDLYSRWLAVPASNKKTSVKPSGTVAKLAGVTPGIHNPPAEHYWQVIRFDSASPYVKILRAAGYSCYDLAPNEPNTTAIYFPVKEMYYSRSEAEVSMWEQLELAAQMQENWADNQVSITVKFDKLTEGPQIARALEFYETRLKSVSFLPHENHGYAHAPWQPITACEYAEAITKLRPFDLNEVGNEVIDKFCDGDACEWKPKEA